MGDSWWYLANGASSSVPGLRCHEALQCWGLPGSPWWCLGGWGGSRATLGDIQGTMWCQESNCIGHVQEPVCLPYYLQTSSVEPLELSGRKTTYFFLKIGCLGATPCCAYSWLCLELILGGPGRLCAVLGSKPKSAMCKTSALPTVLALWLPKFSPCAELEAPY